MSLTESLIKIGADILEVLAENKDPKGMTIDELFQNRKLFNYSFMGWVYATERLEQLGKLTSEYRNGCFYYTLKK